MSTTKPAGRTAAEAVQELLRSLPSDMKLDITAEEMTNMLQSVLGNGRLLTLDEAREFFPSAASLVERGQGEMSVREAAQLLGLSEQEVVQEIRSGGLRAREISEQTFLVCAASVKVFLEKRREKRAVGPDPATDPPLAEMALFVLRAMQDAIYSRESNDFDEVGNIKATKSRGVVWGDGQDPTLLLSGDCGRGSFTLYRGTVDDPFTQHTHGGSMSGSEDSDENFVFFVRGLYWHFKGQGLSWEIPLSEMTVEESEK